MSTITGTGPARHDMSAQYGQALTHSRRVRRWKILLPIMALVISLGFIAVSWVRTFFPENLEIAGARIENGKVVMEKPAISGRNDNGISYYMNAARALQDIANPNDIMLEDIDASVPIRGNLIARVKALSAQFDRSSDRLELTQPFTVNLSSGLDIQFQSARLDIPGGEMSTSEPIAIAAEGMSMVANQLNITDKGKVIKFSGQVRLNIEPALVRKIQK
jgi:lipopolysaccharide export system protein LptC